MSKYNTMINETQASDWLKLADNLLGSDKLEVEALFDGKVKASRIINTMAKQRFKACYSVVDNNGGLLCICGVTEFDNLISPFLLCSNKAPMNKMLMLKVIKELFNKIIKPVDLSKFKVENIYYKQNVNAERLIKWLGFTIGGDADISGFANFYLK